MKVYKMLFSEAINLWLLYEKKIIKESSLARYKLLINKYIKPVLGNYKLYKLNQNVVNDFIDNKLEKINNNLSRNMIHDIATLVKQILKFNNIDIQIKIPSKVQPKINIFTENERIKIENNALIYDNLKSFGILLSLYMGLRIGEICALQNKNFDLENRVLKIENTLIRIQQNSNNGKKTKIILSKPKSESSLRIIPIPSKLFSFIQNYIFQNNEENFFLTNSPKFIEPRSYYNYYLKCLKKWNIRKHKFHDLRHTFATYSIEKGFEPKVLSEILGHSNINTTFNLYVHPSIETKRKYMDCL